MKVKVLKASLSTYWYADHVGEVFEVKDTGYSYYLVTKHPEYKGWGLVKTDVEIINEEKAMKREDKVNIEMTLQEAAWLYAISAKANGTVGYDVYKNLKGLVDPEGTAYNECLVGKFDLIDYKSVQSKFEAAIFDCKTPEQIELDKLMSQISELTTQAEKLQALVNK